MGRRGCPFVSWERDRDLGALAEFALEVDLRIVEGGRVLDNRKPKSSAALLAAAPLVHTIEALEDLSLILLGNADARVAHAYAGAAALGQHPHEHTPALAVVADGVGDQVADQLVEQPCVALDGG